MRLEQLTSGGHGPWSFQVAAGESVAIVAGSGWARQALVSLLCGQRPPDSGRLRLLGQDLEPLGEAGRLALFREVGVVREDGGLISNLRAWENIALPVRYHAGAAPQRELLPEVVRRFASLGIAGDSLEDCLDSLPGLLPQHWRRLVSLVRALVREPRLLLYDALLDGLPAGLARSVVELTRAFHCERDGRTSIHLVTDAAGAAQLAASRTIELREDA